MSTEDVLATPLELCAKINRRFSFALHQNSVPFLLETTITNREDRAFENITVTIEATPPFIRRKVLRLDRLDTGQVLSLPPEDLATDVEGGLLGRLTEAETGHVIFTAADSAEVVLGRWESDVEILARNEWGGLHPLPELIAAFVQPNDAVVDRILKQASDILTQHNLPSGLTGYLSGSRQWAWALVQAIWGSICALGVAYVLNPASFEESGQKVRSPSQIWDGRVGTCLDTSLLFAAALEQCGLHPLVILLHGHAFVGCWLIDDAFPVAVVDDAASLRTRIQLGELLAFETTLATQRPAPAFRDAVATAERELSEEHHQPFIAAIDIKRTRMQGFLPLASATDIALRADASMAEAEAPPFEVSPQWEPAGGDADSSASPQPGQLTGRLRQWQGKLLDLTLRNRLLNFRITSGALPLDAPDAGGIENRLADGTALRLVPRPPLMAGADPRSSHLHEQRRHEEIVASYARAALERNEVTVGLQPDELTARLLALFRTARTGLQENGANALHLAVGFLVWRKDERQAVAYRAPLVLIPVSLDRSSVRSGFRLSLGDEEPRLNPTLLQMLEQDFHLSIPELREELPKDESGVDIPAVWHIVAERVKDIRGWEVVPEVVVSTFSFTKFLMWKDMVDRLDELNRNRVVEHLIQSTREPYPHVRPFPERHTLDTSYTPDTTYCPLPADSSQLAAVMAAAGGQDFVLIGPPGTGKSQTITNLICHCLAKGKTVLFIAEKTAALEVVHRRLEAAGVGPFCLELHSNKVNKLRVLAQLELARTTEGEIPSVSPYGVAPTPQGRSTEAPTPWAQAVAKVQALRSELNGVVERLHSPYRNGLTIFEATSRVLSGRNVPEVGVSWPAVDTHDVEDLARLREHVRRLGIYASAAGLRTDDPLAPLRHQAWTPRWQSSVLTAARHAVTMGNHLQDAAANLCEAAKVSVPLLDPPGRKRLGKLAEAFITISQRGWAFVLREDADNLNATLRSGASVALRRRELVPTLSVPYDLKAAGQLDLAELHATLQEADRVWWLRRLMLQRRVRRTLLTCAQEPSGVSPALASDLEKFAEIREHDRQLTALEPLRAETNGLWRGLETDPNSVEEAGRLTKSVQTAAIRLTDAAPKEWHAFPRQCSEPAGLVALADRAQRLLNALKEWVEAVEALRQLVAAEEAPPAADTPAVWEQVCSALLGNATRLQAWCAWRKEREVGAQAGLSSLVDALEAGRVVPGSAEHVFDVNYCRWWLPGAVDQDATLCAFVPVAHEAMISEFAAADDSWLDLVGLQVRNRLAARLRRTMAMAKRGSPESRALGVLKHEVSKKKRHVPVRELLGLLQPILPSLAPCMLMSPLSVAQYLAPDATPFDLVVFDEASQIPVWDAIGAIARGQQLVVVGDPKQLPPTAFFGRAEDEQSDELDADLESILDDCRGASLPELQLNWHYRSRHESLIAFSNEQYYANTLVTFPSAVDDDHAVRYHHVAAGIYEKGASRTNPVEARAVADFVLSRLRDPKFAASGQSVGVVTFNAQQQHLIEDLFEQERGRDESLERFFAEGQPEPVFVKNLESVQGDERDVMCFSITYGPDQHGAVSMNFGPLNKQGGERRLNVAITRARRELHVFAALQPEHIDLNRTRAKGAADLKRFLQYTQRGLEVASAASEGSGPGDGGKFLQVVCRALQARGWQVQTDVGSSQLRVDVAVVDPDVPAGFLAAIICDGPTGDAAATARDRDLLRQRLLEGLGWSVRRTWVMEWWVDSASALERLHGFLTELLEEARERRAAAAGRSEAEPGASNAISSPPEGDPAADDLATDQFRTATIPSAELDAERFFDKSYDARLTDIIRQIVILEGPIRGDVLARRVGRIHGFARTGAQILDRVSILARKEFERLKEEAQEFFWPTGTPLGEWERFRRAGADGRPVDEISLAELRALARACLAPGREMEEGVRTMARVAGLQRLRAPSRERLERAWRAEVRDQNIAPHESPVG